ncbi:MAG: hypothetical protein JWM68_3171 [Verrucomicrobiales bacterium]|nr:hypothetical protein [Verrucomicrobiales bacterium]
MKGFKPWLVIGLVFFAGIAVGVFGTRSVVRHHVEPGVRDPKFAHDRFESAQKKMEEDLISKLDMTPAQQTNVHEVFVSSGEQFRKLHSDFEPRMKEIFDAAHEKISATLTPEQREKFEKITRERRERFEKFKEKGFGPPHHGERSSTPPEKR